MGIIYCTATNVVVYTPEDPTYKFLDEFGFSLSGETGFVFELKVCIVKSRLQMKLEISKFDY